MQRSSLAIVLAAGEGTRMKSAISKVLHPLAGAPMLVHVVDAAREAAVGAIALVVGHDGDAVKTAAEKAAGGAVEIFVQRERLGTAHAVLAARETIAKGYDDVLVLFGDTPLLRSGSIARARQALAEGADVAVVGFRTDDPAGYGRLIEKDGELLAIREEKDANAAERQIGFCNSGIMAIAGGKALAWLEAVGNDNAKGEFYLTDIVAIARAEGGRAVAVEAQAEEALGVNTRAQLAEVEAIWQQRKRREMMDAGVTMIAPETVFLARDTLIEADVTIEPNVVFGPGVRVRSGAVVHAFCHIEGATIGANTSVGPFARLRPGAVLGAGSRVGNFCEVKKAAIGEGAKVNHLTYIGDAVIGARVNVGAGTITCNYDGINKHLTEIGPDSFVGSNTSLVAPVRVGAGAYIASGSVITEAVADDALAFGRARQVNKEGRAADIRARNEAFKAGRKSD